MGRRLSLCVVAIVVLTASLVPTTSLAGPSSGPAAQGVATAATALSPDAMVAIFEHSPHLTPTGLLEPPAITGDAAIDQRIRDRARQRGYVPRRETAEMVVAVDGSRLHHHAAHAWQQLRSAAAADGVTLTLTSGFRTVATQRSIFNRRLQGSSDQAIDAVLATTAPPGFSKHHTGLAIDVRSGPYVLHQFAESQAYAWLSANNWANSKAHGWLPSYPDGAGPVGPDPEPWEFVWVGTTSIICADFTPTADRPFCDDERPADSGLTWLHHHGLVDGCSAPRFCPQQSLTRGDAAILLWRLHGRQAPDSQQPFTDVAPGTTTDFAVRWLAQRTVVSGTSPTTYEPYGLLSRGRFLVMVWRLSGRPSATIAYPFIDKAPDRYVEVAASWAAELELIQGIGGRHLAPTRAITRGEAALILYRFYRLIPTLI